MCVNDSSATSTSISRPPANPVSDRWPWGETTARDKATRARLPSAQVAFSCRSAVVGGQQRDRGQQVTRVLVLSAFRGQVLGGALLDHPSVTLHQNPGDYQSAHADVMADEEFGQHVQAW